VWQPVRGAINEIEQRIAPTTLRLSAEEALNLPSRVDTTIRVKLPPNVMREYKLLRKAYIAELDSGIVTAQNAAVATQKCRQLANGAIYNEGEVYRVHDAKLEALVGLYEELNGKPLIVVYEFKHDLAALQSVFGEDLPHLGGGVSKADAQRYVKQWNAGELPVFAIQAQSGSHGLNLQRGGCNLAFYGLTWSLDHYDQMIKRVWRQGQRDTVHVHHIVAVGTVDELILKALATKHHSQKQLLDLLKRDAHQR
jgi:SNF2 family DNA or RNA helicase